MRLSALRGPKLAAETVIGYGRQGVKCVKCVKCVDGQHQHFEEMRMREALELWQVKLHIIVTPPPPNVVALRG